MLFYFLCVLGAVLGGRFGILGGGQNPLQKIAGINTDRASDIDSNTVII